MDKRVPYIICFVAGAVLAAGLVLAVNSGRSDKQIERLSGEVAAYKATNTDLTSANLRLTESNNRSIAEVKQLRRELSDAVGRTGSIKSLTGKISSGLEKTGSDIDGIIAGIGEIKKLLESLP